MGRIRTAGLVKRGEIWHIDKRVGGRRINRSTGTRDLEEAEQYLVRLLEENRRARVYGIRPARSFEEASAKFVLENQHKRSIKDDVGRLNQLMPGVGKMSWERVHSGVLQPWIEHRKKEGVSNGTINHGLKIVRRILN